MQIIETDTTSASIVPTTLHLSVPAEDMARIRGCHRLLGRNLRHVDSRNQERCQGIMDLVARWTRFALEEGDPAAMMAAIPGKNGMTGDTSIGASVAAAVQELALACWSAWGGVQEGPDWGHGDDLERYTVTAITDVITARMSAVTPNGGHGPRWLEATDIARRHQCALNEGGQLAADAGSEGVDARPGAALAEMEAAGIWTGGISLGAPQWWARPRTPVARHASMTLRSLTCAAHAWAEAAGTAGAMAPRHVATALLLRAAYSPRYSALAAAAIAGTQTALDEHRADGSNGHTRPEPRGLEIEIRGGKAIAILWRTANHLVALRAVGSDSRPSWSVEIDAHDGSGKRIAAAVSGAWRTREWDDEDEILSAASAVGLTREQLEDNSRRADGLPERAATATIEHVMRDHHGLTPEHAGRIVQARCSAAQAQALSLLLGGVHGFGVKATPIDENQESEADRDWLIEVDPMTCSEGATWRERDQLIERLASLDRQETDGDEAERQRAYDDEVKFCEQMTLAFLRHRLANRDA